jgi:hypothetical protein
VAAQLQSRSLTPHLVQDALGVALQELEKLAPLRRLVWDMV